MKKEVTSKDFLSPVFYSVFISQLPNLKYEEMKQYMQNNIFYNMPDADQLTCNAFLFVISKWYFLKSIIKTS